MYRIFTCLALQALSGWMQLASAQEPVEKQQFQLFTDGQSRDATKLNGTDEQVPSPEQIDWHPAKADVATVLPRGDRNLVGVRFAPNGKWLSTRSERFVDIWTTANWTIKQSFPMNNQWCHAAWSPQSDRIAYSDTESSVTVRSAADGVVKFRLVDLPARPLRISWSPDGKWIAMGGDGGQLVICDVEQKKIVKAIETDGQTIFGLAFSANSNLLAIRTQGEAVLFWDRRRNVIIHRFLEQGLNGTVKFSPDGTRYAITRGTSLNIHDCNTNRVAYTIDCRRFCGDIEWSSDGRFMVLNQGSHLTLCAPDTGNPLHEFRCTTKYLHAMSLSSDARQLATVDANSVLVVWNVSSLEKLKRATVRPVPMVATVGERYSDLVSVQRAPADERVFGSFYEFGYWKEPTGPWGNYWVYSAPNWYVFKKSRIGVYRPPNPLPQPVELNSGIRRVWLAFPGAI